MHLKHEKKDDLFIDRTLAALSIPCCVLLFCWLLGILFSICFPQAVLSLDSHLQSYLPTDALERALIYICRTFGPPFCAFIVFSFGISKIETFKALSVYAALYLFVLTISYHSIVDLGTDVGFLLIVAPAWVLFLFFLIFDVLGALLWKSGNLASRFAFLVPNIVISVAFYLSAYAAENIDFYLKLSQRAFIVNCLKNGRLKCEMDSDFALPFLMDYLSASGYVHVNYENDKSEKPNPESLDVLFYRYKGPMLFEGFEYHAYDKNVASKSPVSNWSKFQKSTNYN